VAPPYRLELTGLLQPGTNSLAVTVFGPPVRQAFDSLSQFTAMEPLGLFGPVSLASR